MTGDRYPLQLQIRSIVVSFAASARTLVTIGDEDALRRAFDRALMLLDSVARPDDPGRTTELLAARDELLQLYRHHLEACDCDDLPLSPVERSREA